MSRRLPDTLVIDIVERQPAAIWQNNQQLSLIDADGVVLEPVRIDHMPDLPLVIGPDANRHIAGLGSLLAGGAAAAGRRSPARPGSASGAGTYASRAANCSPCPKARMRRAARSRVSR